MTHVPRPRTAVLVTGLTVLFAAGLVACQASRPNAKTPIGPRPGPEDEATQQDRTGARQREGIAPPKAGPERPPPPPITTTPAPATSGGAGGSAR